MIDKVYDLNLYKAFYVCSISKSFSEAASKLNITQPAISYSIKTLEEQLHTQLFNRTNNGIELTKEGKALQYYVEKANSALLSGNKIIDELVKKEIFEINVGVPTHIGAYYFINYLKKFNKKYPNIKVNIIDKKTIAISDNKSNVYTYDYKVEKKFTNKVNPKRNIGYPLDSISITPEYNKYTVDLTDEENNKLNDKCNKEIYKFILRTLDKIC